MTPRRHPVQVGDVAVLQVAAVLSKRGEMVLFPFSSNTRYDIALDRSGSLYRIQCKSGRYRDGAVIFNVCSSLAHRGGPRRDYRGDVDAFGVYCPELKTTYLVPLECVKSRTYCQMRVEPAKNGQAKRVMEARQFVIA